MIALSESTQENAAKKKLKLDKMGVFFLGVIFGFLVDWLIADQIAQQFPFLYTRLIGYLDIMGTIEFSIFAVIAIIFHWKQKDIWCWFCVGPLCFGLAVLLVLQMSFIITEFLVGTWQILVFFLVLFALVFVVLWAIKPVDKVFLRLNKTRIARGQLLFKFNYVAIVGIVTIIIATVILAALKEYRGDYWFFMVFSFFSFFAGAISLGLLAIFVHILKIGEYRLGNGLLLLLGAALFGMAGVNFHDVLWCGTATDWFQVERIGGYDLQAWFTFFQILDPARWDYRIMGFYMIFQASLEAFTAILLFHKFFKLNADGKDPRTRRLTIATYVLCLAAAIILGLVEFVFDSPWYFTDLQYYLTLFLGVGVVAILFIIVGICLPESNNNQGARNDGV